MAKVTYTAPEDDSEVVTYMGVKFFSGQPKEIDDEAEAGLLAKAAGNPFFTVDGAAPVKAKEAPASPAAKGAAAAAAGKPRTVPPAYRGKPAEVEWLTGYDATAED
jgi:hypothetical protein